MDISRAFATCGKNFTEIVLVIVTMSSCFAEIDKLHCPGGVDYDYDDYEGRQMVFASIREHDKHCDLNIKNLLCELVSNAKIWGARTSEHSFNFASKFSKGKILRAVKNFNGPLITPAMF